MLSVRCLLLLNVLWQARMLPLRNDNRALTSLRQQQHHSGTEASQYRESDTEAYTQSDLVDRGQPRGLGSGCSCVGLACRAVDNGSTRLNLKPVGFDVADVAGIWVRAIVGTVV